MSEQRLSSLAPDRPAIACAVGAVLARDEVHALRGQVGRDPALQLSAVLVLDAAEGGTIAAHQRGVRERRSPDLNQLPQDLDLLVISDRQEQIGRDLAFAIIEQAIGSTSACRLSRFCAPRAGAEPITDTGLAWYLLEAIDADRREDRIRRLIDVLAAALALIVTAPLMALLALVIRLDSPGPAFLVQERLGRMRVPFRCIKFRTMQHDAERETGPVWATVDDRRVTRVGRLLRRSRLDELPQFLNVLRGEMSLVGVRPIRRSFADHLVRHVPFYDLRFLDRPGLTGWAQVNQVYPSTLLQQIEKFRYDYHYIRNRSLGLDFYIMLRTIWVVLGMKGT